VANSGVTSTFIIPDSPLSPKIVFECLEPQIIFLSTTARGSIVFSGHILIPGFIITLSLIKQLSPIIAFSKTDT
jgi:hypothetical protein